MPSEHSPGQDRSYTKYDHIKDEYGENPARWLARSLLDDKDAREMVRIRIFSIDDIELARQWIEVERDLARGPRQQIVAWLNERITTLKVIGERPDRLTERSGRDLPDKEWYYVDDDGERVPWEEVDRSIAGASLGGDSGRAFATDGGEDA